MWYLILELYVKQPIKAWIFVMGKRLVFLQTMLKNLIKFWTIHVFQCVCDAKSKNRGSKKPREKKFSDCRASLTFQGHPLCLRQSKIRRTFQTLQPMSKQHANEKHDQQSSFKKSYSKLEKKRCLLTATSRLSCCPKETYFQHKTARPFFPDFWPRNKKFVSATFPQTK